MQVIRRGFNAVARAAITPPAFLLLVLLTSCQQRESRTDPQSLIEAADSGRFAAVNKQLKTLREDPDSQQLVLLAEGIVLLRSGNASAALSPLAEVDQEGPLRHTVMRFAGEALNQCGRLGEAAAILSVLVQEQPEQPEGRRWLAASWYDLGAFDAAIEHLDVLTRLQPDDYRPHHLLAIMYSDFEQHNEAIRHLDQALKLSTSSAPVSDMKLLLAENLASERQYERALRLALECPETENQLAIRAECLLATGNIGAAAEAIRLARDRGDKSVSLCLIESALLEQQGQADAALQLLQDGLQYAPASAELYYRKGLIEKQLGDDAASALTLKQWEHYRDLSAQLTQLNLKAIEEPWNAEVREQLADVCQQLEKPQLAEMWRQAAAAAAKGGQIQTQP